jgi:DNA repair exonuclease SbcCD ATPase subunit|nr:MAG TPA: tail tape measure protein [Caudoviricetes sp.]
MSALSFKINAETDKLKSFISMLEQLRRVLADIPDSTKDFDVINRKIGEMEARVEQSMRKIAQMERQAMDAAAKTAASATIGNTGGDSTAGAQAAKAETAAYHELIEELKAVNASKKENVILISQYEAQIKRLKSEIDSLNKAESQGMKLTQNQKSSRLEATLSIEEYKQAISRARKELVNQIKFEQVARGSIDEMSQALSRMRTVYRSLNESERTSGWGQNLLKNIESIDTKVKELDATMGVHTRKVGDYASGFNNLGFQIQQVARELPSLAYGPQIFFSAISNNLPMLADEIARAKKSVDELKKAGQTFTPVWKQIASSIFSWQTLLVAGVTVLTLYGKEITSWVASLFKGKTAIDTAAAALEQFNSAMAQGSVSAQSELTKLNLLYNAATDLSKPYEERAEAVKKLQDIYPAYFGNMAAEQVMVGNAVGAYEDLRDAIIEVAQAKAAQELITESSKSLQLIEATGDAYTNYSLALKEYRIAYAAAKEASKGKGPITFSLTSESASFERAKANLTKFRSDFINELSNLSKDGDDLWKRINEGYEGDVDAFIAAINAGIEKLTPAAEKLYTTLTPEELNAEAKKARDEAINAAKKAASDQERNLKELNQKLQKLRDDALQAEVDSMKDGTAKKLAQIDRDYQRRARAIETAEAEIRRLQDGELTKNQQAQIEALNKANETQHGKERGRVLLSGQTSPEDISSQFDEEIKSWDGYLQKYGTFREKLQATKDIYDRRIEEAGTVGERKSLEAERDAAIVEIEVQAGEWIRELTDKTKDKLAELKTELEASLQSLESEYNALDSSDTEQAQKLRAEINKTKAQINAVNKAASNTQTSPKENAIEKWQRLEKTLGDIADGFKDIGDAVGGTTGEIISAAGEIAATATSMISSIVTLTDSSANAITTTSTTATNAIKAVERASVILAIIQAVLSVATKIASLFNNDEEKQAEIDRLQGRIEQLQWELDNANAIRLQRNSFDAVKNVKDAYNNAAKSIMSAYKDVGNFVERFFIRRSKEAEIEKKAIQSIADAYSNLKYTDSNLLGKNKFGDTRERLNNLAEQQLLLQKQINAENDKKKTDKSKIREWERQIQELGAEAAEVINEVVETIIGGTAEEIAKELGDAFIDAFMEGENAAEAWGEKVDEIVADIMRQMIISKFLEERIGEVFNRYKSKWFKDGVFIGIDNVIDSMSGFADDLNKVGDEFQAIWDSLPAETKELLGNAGAAQQEATERGFKAMSQDTGDELNGRFTDIQGKVTDIRGYVMMQTQSIIGLLNSIGNIETAIYTSVQVDNELLRYAVMTYMEIVEINGNTAVMKAALTEIREDIAAIKRNTSEL